MKKVLALLLALFTVMLGLCGCADEDVYVVGIAQFAEHGSLDNCREGFVSALKDAGFEEGANIEIKYMNAQADMGITNQIASTLAGECDLICAIATPMAQASFTAASGKNIPVIYTAVNDPVKAGLADENGTAAGNTTGTSDKLPVEEQLKTIRAFMPDAKKIGILYCTSEVNSISTIEEYKALAGQYGFEIIESGVNTSADIPMAADSLLPNVDCISNLTDNTVVNSLAVILDKANALKIPVFGSEIEQVKLGCVASAGIEYTNLGYMTGEMAVKVMKGGAQASDIPFETVKECELYINSDALNMLGMKCPDDLKEKAIETAE